MNLQNQKDDYKQMKNQTKNKVDLHYNKAGVVKDPKIQYNTIKIKISQNETK